MSTPRQVGFPHQKAFSGNQLVIDVIDEWTWINDRLGSKPLKCTESLLYLGHWNFTYVTSFHLQQNPLR